MRPILIAFCGNGRGAGKDTAAGFARAWCKERDLSFEEKAFAQLGKELIAKSLGLDDYLLVDHFKIHGDLILILDGDVGPYNTIDGRDFIISLLEGVRELFGQDFWTDAILSTDWVPTADVTVVTDLRFPHEAKRVEELGGRVIEIRREAAEGGTSESELTGFNLDWIDNNDTLDKLRLRIFELMDLIKDHANYP